MSSLILLILKILGIIFLSILILILLILCALLFVSVTYRAQVVKGETIQVHAVGGWLWRILSVHCKVEQTSEWKPDLQVKLFGYTILRPLEEKPPKKKKEKNQKQPEQRPVKEAEQPVQPQPKKVEAEQPTKKYVESSSSSSETAEEEKKQSVFEKIRCAVQGICDKIKLIIQKIKNLLEMKDKYLDFWNQEEHKRARGSLYKLLWYLLKKIRPRKMEGYVRFGFDDPSKTGQCMAAASVLYAWYPKKFQVIPEFEEEVMECDVLVKGHIRLYIFVVILIKVLLNKDIRSMYKHWKQL